MKTHEPSDEVGASVRKPHAVLDISSRRLKALKIERLLQLTPSDGPLRMLEVGTGSGGIAHYFGTHESMHCEVDAVDVVDNRLVTNGYRYRHVEGTQLPFADAIFDVVLSNHVIEHVGDDASQRAHLAELQRVLKPGGRGYLAVPNRWMLIEPHFRLAFLSWLPKPWRTTYLRTMRKGVVYDCEPLMLSQVEHLLADTGLAYRNVCVEALRLTFEIEHPSARVTRWLRCVPDRALAPFSPLIPTLIYRFSR